VASLAGCGSKEEPSEADRLATRLDRAAVHFHVALRERLDGPNGAAFARELAAAGTSAERARALAQQIFERREEGAERLREGWEARRPLAPLLVESSDLDVHTDRAAFLLALLAETVDDDRRIPKYVLVYEASRLDPAQVSDPTLRRLARAASALVYSRAGYCEHMEREVRALGADELTEAEVLTMVDRWLPNADALERDRLHRDVTRVVSVLAGGARACCGIRRGNKPEAARSIDRWVDDAEALGVSESRVAILRAFAALAQGDEATAREQLERVRDVELSAADTPRYAMVRDALASSETAALRDATERMVDRRWVSALVLSGAHQVFREDGLLDALGQQPEARALRQLARGEAAVVEEARSHHPMFDQAHAGDQGTLDRLADLFR
jgi:hypothetical protein